MFPLQATRPYLLARRFILAYASTLLHKSVLYSPFYFSSSTFSFLPNAAHPPYWILLPWLSLLAPPLSHFTPLLASAHMQALPLPLISISWTNSRVAPFRLSNNFLPYTLFIVIDKTALSILTARVVMAIYSFRSLTSRDLSHLRIQAFTIFKAFPPPIQVIPSPPGSYHLQLPINGIYRNYHISNAACFIFLGVFFLEQQRLVPYRCKLPYITRWLLVTLYLITFQLATLLNYTDILSLKQAVCYQP